MVRRLPAKALLGGVVLIASLSGPVAAQEPERVFPEPIDSTDGVMLDPTAD